MKAWQVALGIVALGGGAFALYALTRKSSGGAPPPVVSVTNAATDKSSGDSDTNKYDAIIGIAGVLGGVISSGIESGWFESDDNATNAVTASSTGGIAAPGQTLIF